MSVLGRWLRRWRSRRSVAAPSEVGTPAPPVEPGPPPLSTDPERALRELRAARNTGRERELLERVLALHRRGPPAPALALEAALALAERGDEQRALELSRGLSEPGARLLAADLHARRAELREALGHVERLLADDFDYPGALERQRRWAEQTTTERSTAPSQDATLLGGESALGELAIVREVGRGGSATVYEAIDSALRRRVALKVYHQAAPEQDRLLREARLGARFAGAGVVRVYDVRLSEGVIVLEWVPGGSLEQRVRAAEREWLWPIDGWFRPLAQTLARVHAARYVHADLKPANVLLRRPGDPVLADLGLAGPWASARLGGSVGYLPPERDPGAALDPADDVHALGRILELAVGALASGNPALRPELRPWTELARLATSPKRPRHAADLLGLLT